MAETKLVYRIISAPHYPGLRLLSKMFSQEHRVRTLQSQDALANSATSA